MQGVSGQWNGNLEVNGKQLPLHPKSLLYLQVYNSIHQNLPSLRVGYKDEAARNIASLDIRDGTQVKLIMGDGGSGQVGPLNFTVMGDLRMKGNYGAEQVEFSAVLDNIKWLRSIVSGAVNGTSGDAISRVAGLAGLSTEITQTADKMVWLPNNKPLAAYARHVMERGWASATSCMMLGIQDSGLLRYVDLDRIISQSPIKQFGVGAHPVLQYQIASKSHIYNNVAAYGSTSTNHTPEGVFKELTKIGVRQLSNYMPASNRLIGEIGDAGGRIMSRALDVGNVHKKFYEAVHQNMRIRTMFAHDVHILTDKIANVNLFDMVGLELVSKATLSPLLSQTGDYMVTNLVRLFAGNRYLEKITLTSQSTN